MKKTSQGWRMKKKHKRSRTSCELAMVIGNTCLLLPSTTTTSRLSTHLFKYASQLSAQFFWPKPGSILYCLNMSCRVICHECMNFLWLKFNVGLLKFCWNVSNDRRSSSYICLASVWTSEKRNWSSMSRTLLCRASRPLKLVALSNSTNVSIGWISLQYVLPIVLDFPDGTFTHFILPPQCPLAWHVRFAQLCDNFTSLGFGQTGRLMFHPFPVAIHQITGSRKQYE